MSSPTSKESFSILPSDLQKELSKTNEEIPVMDQHPDYFGIQTSIKSDGNGGILIRGRDGEYHGIEPEYAASARIQYNIQNKFLNGKRGET